MSRRLAVILLLGLFAAVTWLPATADTPKLPSTFVEKQVTKLNTKVHWYDSLDEAKEKAKKENKLVLWLHALGDLDGTT
jgi:hypothetical protein